MEGGIKGYEPWHKQDEDATSPPIMCQEFEWPSSLLA